jgi:hypothetical protein
MSQIIKEEDITRIEIINHSSPYFEIGRAFVARAKKDFEKITFSVQDEGRTLKIFLSKKEDV